MMFDMWLVVPSFMTGMMCMRSSSAYLASSTPPGYGLLFLLSFHFVSWCWLFLTKLLCLLLLLLLLLLLFLFLFTTDR
jgi:hypothetical protein